MAREKKTEHDILLGSTRGILSIYLHTYLRLGMIFEGIKGLGDWGLSRESEGGRREEGREQGSKGRVDGVARRGYIHWYIGRGGCS